MAKPKNQKPPFALRALAAFAVTLAALFVLLLAAYALPGEPVRDHVYDSAVKIAGEGLYPEYLNFKLFQMDNYTDTIMLTEAASADEPNQAQTRYRHNPATHSMFHHCPPAS